MILQILVPIPTDSPQSMSNKKNGRRNEQFTYDVLKKANSNHSVFATNDWKNTL